MSLSHLDEQGRARMVDVSAKPETERVAIAEAFVRMNTATVELINSHGVAKGELEKAAHRKAADEEPVVRSGIGDAARLACRYAGAFDSTKMRLRKRLEIVRKPFV